ncbi:MAG: HEAT repeat domain-containing protein, partial [Planctomycetota bacterium]
MGRLALLVCLLAAAAAADERREHFDARKALLAADFETLPPADRESLFLQLTGLDHQDAMAGIVEVVSHYSAYLDWIELQISKWTGKVRKVDRQMLSERERALRSSWERSLQKEEKRLQQAERSLEGLVTRVGRFQDDRAIAKALQEMARSPVWRVRYMLASVCAAWHKSLGRQKTSQRLLGTLRRLKGDQEPRVRVAVARSAGAFLRAESLEILRLYIRDADWRVRAAAVQSLRKSRSDEAVGVLIGAMRKEKGRLLDDINEALKEMTGQNHGYPDIWARWWHDVGKRIPQDADGAAKRTPVRSEDANRFYGIRTRSKRILYVIDISGSMAHPVDPLKRRTVITGRPAGADEGPAPGKTRLEVAQNELKRAVRNLPSDAL